METSWGLPPGAGREDTAPGGKRCATIGVVRRSGARVESHPMRRLLVLFTLAAGVAAFGVVACGGDDKPPLTPDGIEPTLEAPAEAGAPAAPATPAN
jgi:hypothetical protein